MRRTLLALSLLMPMAACASLTEFPVEGYKPTLTAKGEALAYEPRRARPILALYQRSGSGPQEVVPATCTFSSDVLTGMVSVTEPQIIDMPHFTRDPGPLTITCDSPRGTETKVFEARRITSAIPTPIAEEALTHVLHTSIVSRSRTWTWVETGHRIALFLPAR